MKDFEKYRWFITSSGKLVIAGKNAEQNEEIVRNNAKEDAVIMHTSSPGSPFSIIKKPNRKDLEETAIFTACFSHDWKKLKKGRSSEVHVFLGSQVLKDKNMKIGTFGIVGKPEKRKVEMKLTLTIQKGKIRAVPESAAKEKIAVILRGNLTKEKAAEKLLEILKTKAYKFTKEEVMAAIPSGNMLIVE